jgi:hypothetical protein
MTERLDPSDPNKFTPQHHTPFPGQPSSPYADHEHGKPGRHRHGLVDVPNAETPPKSKTTAGCLQLLGCVGLLGFGRIYLGYTKLGIIQLVVGILTAGLVALIWGIIDAYRIFTGQIPDSEGHPLA